MAQLSSQNYRNDSDELVPTDEDLDREEEHVDNDSYQPIVEDLSAIIPEPDDLPPSSPRSSSDSEDGPSRQLLDDQNRALLSPQKDQRTAEESASLLNASLVIPPNPARDISRNLRTSKSAGMPQRPLAKLKSASYLRNARPNPVPRRSRDGRSPDVYDYPSDGEIDKAEVDKRMVSLSETQTALERVGRRVRAKRKAAGAHHSEDEPRESPRKKARLGTLDGSLAHPRSSAAAPETASKGKYSLRSRSGEKRAEVSQLSDPKAENRRIERPTSSSQQVIIHADTREAPAAIERPRGPRVELERRKRGRPRKRVNGVGQHHQNESQEVKPENDPAGAPHEEEESLFVSAEESDHEDEDGEGGRRDGQASQDTKVAPCGDEGRDSEEVREMKRALGEDDEDDEFQEESAEAQDGSNGAATPENEDLLDRAFYWQRIALYDVFQSLRGIPKAEVRTQAAREIATACRAVRTICRDANPQTEAELDSTLEELTDCWVNMRDWLDHLPIDPGGVPDDLAFDIFHRILPDIAWVIRSIVKFYEPLVSETGLDANSLNILTGHMRNMVKLWERITTSEFNHKSCSGVYKTLQRNIAIPIQKVSKVFEREIKFKQQQEEKRELARRLEAQGKKREEEEERRRAREDREWQIRQRWYDLHTERKRWEPDPRLHAHLDIRELPIPQPEIDSNGDPFERIELLGHRVKEVPVRVIPEVSWTDGEIDALFEGLERFEGSRVYEKIFRHYCRADRPLRRFNVTEITQRAERIRALFIANDERQGVETRGYLLSLPLFHTRQVLDSK